MSSRSTGSVCAPSCCGCRARSRHPSPVRRRRRRSPRRRSTRSRSSATAWRRGHLGPLAAPRRQHEPRRDRQRAPGRRGQDLDRQGAQGRLRGPRQSRRGATLPRARGERRGPATARRRLGDGRRVDGHAEETGVQARGGRAGSAEGDRGCNRHCRSADFVRPRVAPDPHERSWRSSHAWHMLCSTTTAHRAQQREP